VLEKVLIFFIFLGPLVFFHELGHFFFARLFGVRVEVFSIGFGPKLFSFKRGDTQYAFSLIPLGGYVKMFGDDPLSDTELTPEEEAVAYTKKGKWARFCIVFGGPLANFILAFFIYFSIITAGEKVPQIKFGPVTQEVFLHSKGVRTGDILTRINTQEITSFDDLNMVDSQVENITVDRAGDSKILAVGLDGMKFLEEFSKINNNLRAPILVSATGESFYVKTDRDSPLSLEEILESSITSVEIYKLDDKKLKMQFDPKKVNLEGLVPELINLNGSWEKTFILKKLYPRDLMIESILMASAAEKAKLKGKDIIIGIAGKSIFNFDQLKTAVQSLKAEKPISIKVLNSEGVKELELTPTYKEYNGEKALSIGIKSGIIFYSIMVEIESKGFIDTLSKAYNRTVEGSIKTFLGFKKLITGEVSLKHVGGPIAIGQVASDSFNISLSMFFRLMAIISINLGIINLFPIPVLDGGHIVFILFELVNKGPLSRKKLMYAQQVGMSLLFLLIFVALFNDISRLF
jgi:regulator of sigma E protease